MSAEPGREQPSLSVIGLGKLGACMAASLSFSGFDVVGVDVVPEVVEAVRSGRAPVVEPDLQEMLSAAPPRTTTSYADAIRDTDVTFFVVPTPSEADGRFSTRFAVEAATRAGEALADKDGYHLFVLTSTVLPGACESDVIPALEHASGKPRGESWGFCYSPEFIALGSVIRNFRNPDFILLGAGDERAGDLFEQVRLVGCDNTPPIARMNIVNAELTKLSVNTFVTTKITFGNMLATLCERLPGADVDTITSAIGLDTRIGHRVLKGGLGYGGPCFPRDNRALAHLAATLGEPASLAETTDRTNRHLAERLVARVRGLAQPGDRIAVLGLSYKPDSPVVEESQAIVLAGQLADAGIDVIGFDPLAIDSARAVLSDRIEYAPSAQQAVDSADVVVVANLDPAFRELEYGRPDRPRVVIDCWRFLRDRLESDESVTYLPLGVGSSTAADLVSAVRVAAS